eukprot:5052260-Pleurochrysis_carterae.AAC.1
MPLDEAKESSLDKYVLFDQPCQEANHGLVSVFRACIVKLYVKTHAVGAADSCDEHERIIEASDHIIWSATKKSMHCIQRQSNPGFHAAHDLRLPAASPI